MKIAVIGSNGRVASLVIKEALERGYEVTGFAENEDKNGLKNFVKKEATSLTNEDLRGFDVVVDAVGGWTAETIPNITNAMTHLADVLENEEVRLIVVGGAGSLFVNKEHTITVDQGPDFPDSWKPLSAAHGKGLAYLRASKNLNWLYISPACNFVVDGVRTGEYKLGGEELTLSSSNDSSISYSDYALALVDEIENKKFNKVRISLVSK